jgi:hypothetical protein
MTYAPLPINERTFKLIAAAGVLSLLAAAAVLVFRPNDLGQPLATEIAANDVTSTGSIVQNGGTRREWVDPVRH